MGSGVPIDRGYAWAIVAGAFFNLVILLGVAKSLGIIFVALREYYARSATATSVFYPLMAGFSLLTAPMVTALTELFSVRAVCMAGSVLTTLGLCIGFAGDSLEAIIIPYGIIGGLGVGMVLNPAPLIISRYFSARKALAMGVLFAGTGVGGILGPFVITFFLDYFGLHGTILMIGALSLNTAVGASLYRPLSYWAESTRGGKKKKSAETAAHSNSHPPQELTVQASTLPLLEVPEEDGQESIAMKRPLPGEPRRHQQRHVTLESQAEDELVLPGHLHVSSLSLSNLDLPTTLPETERMPTISERVSLPPSILKRLLHRRSENGELVPLLKTAVLTEPVFVLFSAGCLCGMSGFYWGMLTPAYCEEDLGMSGEETARLLSLMGVGDLAGRLLIAATGDKLLLHCRPQSVGLSLMVIAFCVLVCPFFPSFWTQAGSLVLGQMAFGCFVALSPVALGDLVPADSLSSAWGFLLFFEGLGHIGTPLLIGAIKDAKGTYFGGYFLVSGFCLLGGGLITASNLLHRLQRNPCPQNEATDSSPATAPTSAASVS